MLEVWQRAPFLKLLVPLVLGMLLFDACGNFSALLGAWLAVSVVFLLLIVFHTVRFKYSGRFYYGVLVFVFALLFGFAVACVQRPANTFGFRQVMMGDTTVFHCQLTHEGKVAHMHAVASVDTFFYCRFQARIQWPFGDTTHYKLLPGARVFVQGVLQPAKPPSNPESFDYALFLERKNMAGVLKVHSYTISNETHSLGFLDHCMMWRRELLDIMHNYVSDEKVFGVLSALILGDTSSMDDEVQLSYANAGAVHILAVSGLHVGLIYALLAPVMKRMFAKHKARWLKTLLPMSLLWVYAGITGFSPSVLRASVMFSFFLVSDNFSKKGNAINTLAASALLLLMVDSSLVFDVGFQLSYAAVAGIVLLQKPLEKLLVIEHKSLHQLWKLVVVSLAAQLATLPFTLYYFQQFPTYFLVTNILAIPISTVVLYVMLAFLAFSWCEPLAWMLANLGSSLTQVMNVIVDITAHWPGGVIRGGFVRHFELVAFAFGIFAMVRWWLWTKPRALILAFVAFVWISCCRLYADVNSPETELVFFSSSKGDLLSIVSGAQGPQLYGDSLMQADASTAHQLASRFHYMRGLGMTDVVLIADSARAFALEDKGIIRLNPALMKTDTFPWPVLWVGSNMKSFFWKKHHLRKLEGKQILLSAAIPFRTRAFLKRQLRECAGVVDLADGAYRLTN
jgi:competence protein ComEC